jgi:hypothetical protein
VDHHLAQVNVSRLLAPLDSPLLAPFVAALDEVNAEGERSPGYRWRLQTESGNATDVEGFGWDVGDSHGVIVNLTTCADTRSLSDFIFGGRHLEIMRRRREWFHPVVEATTALWWIPAGTRPGVEDAEGRVRHLRKHGPSPYAFTIRHHYPGPDASVSRMQTNNDQFCPA